MSRLTTFGLTCVLLISSVGCQQSRWAGYGGGGGCCAPQGGVYGAPMGGGGYMAPQQQGNFYSPTGLGTPMNGPTAYMSPYSAPVYGSPYPTTAMGPIDPMPIH